MGIKSDLYTYLKAHTGLKVLVGSRIYPLHVPQDVTGDACTFQIINNERLYSHDGFSGLQETSIQVSAFAATHTAAEAIKDQIIAAMEAWPDSNSKVQSALLEAENELFDPNTGDYHTPLQFIIKYG